MKYIIQMLVVLAIVISFLLGRAVNFSPSTRTEAQIQGTEPLPSLEQIQERIGAEVDGIYGEETEKLWDKAICDQFAEKAYERERQ